jgi:flagellar protein FlgJ
MTSYDWLQKDAVEMERLTGIPAPIILGQAVLESGAGLNSGLARSGKNLFGIKGVGPAGSIWLPTKEHRNGRVVSEMGQFKKYNTYAESMVDHAKLLQKPLYQPFLKDAKTLEDWIQGIHKSPYATDGAYDDKLRNVIRSNGLDKIGSGNYALGYSENLGKGGAGAGIVTPGNGLIDTGGGGGIIQDTVTSILKYIAILVLFVVGIMFLVQSMPLDKAVDQVKNTALDTAGKIYKPLKAVRKLSKVKKAAQ